MGKPCVSAATSRKLPPAPAGTTTEILGTALRIGRKQQHMVGLHRQSGASLASHDGFAVCMTGWLTDSARLAGSSVRQAAHGGRPGPSCASTGAAASARSQTPGSQSASPAAASPPPYLWSLHTLQTVQMTGEQHMTRGADMPNRAVDDMQLVPGTAVRKATAVIRRQLCNEDGNDIPTHTLVQQLYQLNF